MSAPSRAPIALAGLHRVGRQVRIEERRTLLPPDVFERSDKPSFWHDPRAAWPS